MFYLFNSRYFVMALLTLFVILGVVMLKKNQNPKNQNPQVLSASTPDPSASLIFTPSQSPQNSPSFYKNSPSPSEAPASNPSENSKNNSRSLLEFVYPGSKIINAQPGTITLESPDQAGQITDWYKQKISSKNMNTTSFIVTNQNDNVSNKLISSNPNLELKVDIERSAKQNKTTVIVRLD